jgi:signal transduction histidine kinase
VKDGYRAGDVIQRIRQLATKTEPRKARLDLNDVVRDVLAIVRAELQRHEVSFALTLAPDLPSVVADRVQLQQVVLNLVMNALEAMTSVKGRTRELVIRSERHGQAAIAVAVQDTGVGIDAEHMDRLFSAFFTTKPGGMGMGLSISRAIVEAHGGRLWVTRDEPHGVIFHFSLPIDAGRDNAGHAKKLDRAILD